MIYKQWNVWFPMKMTRIILLQLLNVIISSIRTHYPWLKNHDLPLQSPRISMIYHPRPRKQSFDLNNIRIFPQVASAKQWPFILNRKSSKSIRIHRRSMLFPIHVISLRRMIRSINTTSPNSSIIELWSVFEVHQINLISKVTTAKQRNSKTTILPLCFSFVFYWLIKHTTLRRSIDWIEWETNMFGEEIVHDLDQNEKCPFSRRSRCFLLL